MNALIICEKPSVAKTVAAALGAGERKDGYIAGDGILVSWCVGHLVSMSDAGGYDERYKKWRYEDLPILPGGMEIYVDPRQGSAVCRLKGADAPGRRERDCKRLRRRTRG